MTRLAFACYLLALVISISSAEGVQEDQIDRVDCITAYKNCRDHKPCRLSYRNIGSKCTVIEGRCSAIMKHLPACDRIMKDIFTRGFPKNSCVCDKDSAKCREIHEKIYNNPCFGENCECVLYRKFSIRHLKERNLFPHDVSATTIAQVQTKPTDARSRQVTRKNEDQKTLDNSPRRITTKDPATKVSTINGRKAEYDKDHKTKMLEQDETDYKLLTIIFATLLGLFILLVAAFFAWYGIKNIVLCAQGNKVSKGRPGSLQEAEGKLTSNNNISKH